MKSEHQSYLLTLGVLLLLSAVGRAQSRFEATIQQFNAKEVQGYVQPLANMFGANMNAGLHHGASVPSDAFHVRVDIIGMISVVQNEDRVYQATLPSGFVPENGSLKTATVFGGRGTTFKDQNSGLEYKGSDGILNTNVFPFFVPQLTIGTIFGTEATVRYISTPALSGGKLPASTFFGAGLRHSISQYLGERPPLDICVGGFYSTFYLGDLMEIGSMAINLQASKSFQLLTLYGGIASESSWMSLQYTYAPIESAPSSIVDLQLSGANVFRATMGIQIDLQAIQLYSDVNFGSVKHFSGGIGFGF